MLLDVVFYNSTKDLSEVEWDSARPLVITPSPLVADGLRRLLPSGLEIITISKWVSDHLKKINKKKSNKAELMLKLSSVWRHYFPEEDAEIFFRSFEMFTELRSFTLNLDLLSEFLKELDELIKRSVLIFWAFLENEQIIDEHKSYQLAGSVSVNSPLWLIGFKHLSGIQIDMFKEIAEKAEVVIFFPKDVYSETLSSDWIRWILPAAEVQEVLFEKKIQIVYFPKNKLNSVLKSLREKKGQFDISLASQQIEYQFRQEVAGVDQFFKSPEDLFLTKRNNFFDDLSEMVRSKALPLNSVLDSIIELKKVRLKEHDYVSYKILLLVEEALAVYSEFQTTVDDFSIKILKQIIELNSPRVSLATLSENLDSRLYDINEIPYRESDQPLVVIASSNYGSLKSGDGKYSEKMIESLRAIAPLKRAGLEFSYRKSELQQSLQNAESLLLMEEGLEQIDLSWREILNDFSLEVLNSETPYNLKEKRDYLACRMSPGPYPLKMISASRLQSFIDCPRKYYFSFVEKMDHRPEERMKLGPDEMGTLEHAIISRYFEREGFFSDLNATFLNELCNHALSEYLAKNKIHLAKKVHLTTFFELLHFSQNGINYLLQFSLQHSALGIKFEQELKPNAWNLIGSIDCLIFLPEDRVALFDFKRSSAAIGSKKETLAFDKLQIWTYLLYLIKHEKKLIHTWGYLNLSEIDDSQLYEEFSTPVISDEVINHFAQLVDDTKIRLNSEIQFLPFPRLPKVCKFCEVQLFCSKGDC